MRSNEKTRFVLNAATVISGHLSALFNADGDPLYPAVQLAEDAFDMAEALWQEAGRRGYAEKDFREIRRTSKKR